MTRAATVPGTHEWTTEETRILVQAARWVPGQWLDGEWPLEVRGDGVDVVERPGSDGRGRHLAYGALLVHLEAAMRALGWLPEIEFADDHTESNRILRITAASRKRPGADDLAWFAAMSGRATYSCPGGPVLTSDEEPVDGVRVKALSPRQIRAVPKVGAAIARAIAPPDEDLDDSWSAFLVTTVSEARQHLLRAGSVAQRIRLLATEFGLRCTTVTEPFDSPKVRVSSFGLAGAPGIPQLVVGVHHARLR
ncbi:hypothetical protein [Amycolatopsis pittospori]|uniref:hypothetical protein n=1 Tax=Amycolatopsis pittospori TaxID=2749434 RepID=UPI0015F04ADB|nr:hypothetical protein [Amycolatopsis pittospori]